MRKSIKHVLWSVAITLLVVVGIPLIILATGMISMAASNEPGTLEKSLATFTVDRSVAVRAPEKANPYLHDQEAISAGLSHYAAMCVRCHGGPGVEPEEFAKGLNPPAPEMEHIVNEFSGGEIFWITKHGIRMTGMPAFGTTHKDEDLWKTVAFVQKIPELSDEQKQSLKDHVNRTGNGIQHSH